MKEKIIGTICLVLGIVILVTTGSTFAYYTATVDPNTDVIKGEVRDFNVNLNIETIHRKENIIPLQDSLIKTAINNNCVDSNGREVCSLYKITLTNTGEAQILNSFIKPDAGTTYTSDHLRCQLFNSSMTEVSTITTLSNIDSKTYLKANETNLFTTTVTTTQEFYLAIWLTETNANQIEDFDKDYVGQIAFESTSGAHITATFNS